MNEIEPTPITEAEWAKAFEEGRARIQNGMRLYTTDDVDQVPPDRQVWQEVTVLGASPVHDADIPASLTIRPKRPRAPRNPRAERGRWAINGRRERLNRTGDLRFVLKKKLEDGDVIDTLTDILHYAQSRGWDAKRLHQIAAEHFAIEEATR